MSFKRISTAALVVLSVGGQIVLTSSAFGDEAATIEELRKLIELQQQQIKAQSEALQALQQKVEALDQRETAMESEFTAAQAQEELGDIDPVMATGNKAVSVTLSGQVNRGVLWADDGAESNIYNVDNDNSSTRVRLLGRASPSKDLTVGTNIEVQFESNSSSSVSQNDQRNVGPNNFTERKLEFFVDKKGLGTLSVGQGDTASNGTSEVDLSGTGVIGYSSVADLAGGQLFRNSATGALTATDIGDVFSNFDGLSRDDRVRYDTPSSGGFKASASFIADDRWDAALRWAGKSGPFKTALAAAYADPNSATFDSQINGSFSVLHDSGFNITIASGNRDNPNREDGTFGYAKLGYKKGSMAYAVDWTRSRDVAQDGDEATAYGAFLVKLFPKYATEFYAGVRNHELDRPGTPLDDILAILSGARVKF